MASFHKKVMMMIISLAKEGRGRVQRGEESGRCCLHFFHFSFMYLSSLLFTHYKTHIIATSSYTIDLTYLTIKKGGGGRLKQSTSQA